MGQGKKEGWLCLPQGTEAAGVWAEILDEGDGNYLIRSPLNRDRTLRLSAQELQSLVMAWVNMDRLSPAPESVGRVA